MPWGDKNSDEEIFEEPKQEAQRLNVGIAGPPEVGKTHFALTFPEPVYILDTEFGARPLAIKDEFSDKEIHIAEIPVLNKKEEPDAIASLDRLESAIKKVDDSQGGTIIIDSITDVWKWIQTWLEQRQDVKTNNLGEPYRFEWGKANDKYRNLWLLAQLKDMHMVVTGQVKDVYDSSGNKSGETEARWQNQTPHWVDVYLKAWKTKKKASDSGDIEVDYKARFEKCRFERSFDRKLDDVTFDSLKSVLEESFGIKVAE